MQNKKPNLYLHVGPHKTGSTTIQSSFFENSGGLFDLGYIYPKMYKEAAFKEQHSELVTYSEIDNGSKTKNFFTLLHDEVIINKKNGAIISGEEFSNLQYDKFLNVFYTEIESDWNVQYYFYKRPIKELMISNALQFLFGELGYFFQMNYRIEHFFEEFIEASLRKEEFFRKRNTCFIELNTVSKNIAMDLFHRISQIELSALNLTTLNSSIEKENNPNIILSYPIRIMYGMINKVSPDSEVAYQEALEKLNTNNSYDEKILKDFKDFLQYQADQALKKYKI